MKKDWFKVSFYIELTEEEIKNIDIYSHLDFLPDYKKYKCDNVCIWRAKEYSKKERDGNDILEKLNNLNRVENKTMKQQIENIIKENLPKKNEIYPINVEKQDEKWNYLNGFNQALSQIPTSLIADEVLKVVRNEIASIRGFHLLKKDTTKEEILDSLFDLLSTLSPNKENKSNSRNY